MYRLTWRLPLAGLVAFSHLQFSQIRGRQPYLIVRKILYVIEVCDLAHAELSTQTETDTEIAPLIQQVAATSIAEIDQLMAELQEAKNYLQSEGERIEQETVRYTNLTQMASATVRIISDAVSQWHPARNQQNSSASDVAAASAEDNIGAFRKSHHHGQ